MLNQWKQLNVLFIQLQRDFFCGHIWSSSKRAPSLILMEIYCWSQNRASLTRCTWQSQLLPNRYFDFILINQAALLSIFSAFFGKLRKSNSAIFGLSVEGIIQWLTREDRESLCSQINKCYEWIRFGKLSMTHLYCSHLSPPILA